MNSQLILVIVIGICAGISAACLIAASLLAKRNISGDSHADPRFFTDGIAITDRTENLGIHETDHLNGILYTDKAWKMIDPDEDEQ